MKLLKKSIVGIEIQNQRKQQIDEGVAIATRVDALRRTLQDLETQHTRFVQGMKANLENQTKELFDEIAGQKLEIARLEEHRQRLLIPLDEEWLKVTQEKANVDSLKKELVDRVAKVQARESQLTVIGKEIKDRLFKIKTRERELTKIISKQQ